MAVSVFVKVTVNFCMLLAFCLCRNKSELLQVVARAAFNHCHVNAGPEKLCGFSFTKESFPNQKVFMIPTHVSYINLDVLFLVRLKKIGIRENWFGRDYILWIRW